MSNQMNYPAPLREYRQMARVIKTKDSNGQTVGRLPYKMGLAYGNSRCSSPELRVRTLNEIGIYGNTIRQPESESLDNYMSLRETSVIFYQMHREQQQYFVGMNPVKIVTHQTEMPGTKTRTYLNSKTPSQKVLVRASHKAEKTAAIWLKPKKKQETTQNESLTVPLGIETHSRADKTEIRNKELKPKSLKSYQSGHSNDGTSPTHLSFSLS